MRTRTEITVSLVLLALVPTLALGDLGTTPQLLVNTGFEDGEGDVAAQWGLWPPAGKHEGVSSLRDSGVRHTGSYSGRLRVTNPAFDGICTWHHNAVPVQPGQCVVLKFWVRAENVVGNSGCDVQLRRGTQEHVGGAGTPPWKGTFDWRQVVHRVVIPQGVDHICVVPYLNGTGTVWFDDIELYGTPVLMASRTTGTPRIDGKLTEPCWSEGSAVSGFSLADGSGLPRRQTWAWSAYDDKNLYFAFRCEKEPGVSLKKTVTERDGDVWVDDDVELFLNPRGDRGDYYQFIVNPLGTRYDSLRTDRAWSTEWQAAVQETQEAWTVEIALALANLPIDLRVGPNWCVNFCRSDKATHEVSAWSCTFGGFHTPERFGTLEGLDLDFTPHYLKDAQSQLAEVRAAHQAAVAGMSTEGAPADIAEPFLTRRDRIAAAIAEFEALVAKPHGASREQWQQVGSLVAQLRADIADLLSASLCLRAFNVWRAGPDHQPKLGLATALPMNKVFKDGPGFEGEVTKELRLSAARNEFESAQIVALSLSRLDLADCRAEISPLVGPAGARIGGENLRLSVVGYVNTGKPNYDTAFVGEWPDPLLPNESFTLAAGQRQPIWLRAYVPPGARPGDYRGTLTVTGGGEKLEMAVVLHVFDFDLPRRQHLATPFGCGAEELAQWYTGQSDYRRVLSPDVWTRWNEFLLDYRITPTRAGQAFVVEETGPGGRATYDYSILDECLNAIVDRLPPKGVNMAGVGTFGWRASQGAAMSYTEGEAHGGQRAGLFQWPKTESWASLSRSMQGRALAERGCSAFRFWIKATDAAAEQEVMDAYINGYPKRWVTQFTVGGTEWHEVRLPVERYGNNLTGAPLTLDDLRSCDNFQLVVGKKDQAFAFLIDDIVAECEDGEIVIDDFELESELAEVQGRVAAHLKHWKDKGWFEYGHCYGWDEVAPQDYPQALAAYRRVLAVAPDAPIMQTYCVNRTPTELIGSVKIWCAITSLYNEDFLEARRKAGEDVWLYVCCGPRPPFANFFIDQQGVDHRVLFWQAWQRHATGVLYWRVNYWYGLLPTTGDEPRWPDVPWDCEKLTTYREFKVNGDGWLIYPGRDWTPLPSVRLENIRDGIEDYEYLWLLRELDPENKLLVVGDDISQSLTKYCRDPKTIEAKRLAVARAIEAARARR